MPRPDDRPLKRLPQLTAKKATLERCVFCPKLCRSACPVSNTEPRETLTPWGKMSMAYFAANESVELNASFAKPAWACTGCFGCREHCDHKNDVAGTLFEARSALLEANPELHPEATRVLERFSESSKRALGNTARDSRARAYVDSSSRTAVLVGCQHARHNTDGGIDTVRAVATLMGTKVAVLDVCCGAPLLHAGATKRFAQQGELFAQAVKHLSRDGGSVIVADAGCASTLRVHHAAAGLSFPIPINHFAEFAAHQLSKLGRVAAIPNSDNVRWHDPCQLGRGLGVYDQPRHVLSRLLGRAPEEFERNRADARCSGAGGLLPVTMPEIAHGVANDRVADHERSGGGAIVTACASSARAFAKAGATDVIDLATLVMRSLSKSP